MSRYQWCIGHVRSWHTSSCLGWLRVSILKEEVDGPSGGSATSKFDNDHKHCHKDMYSNLHILKKAAGSFGVTSCEYEQSFSTLQCLNTYLCKTLETECLLALALINIHYGFSINYLQQKSFCNYNYTQEKPSIKPLVWKISVYIIPWNESYNWTQV